MALLKETLKKIKYQLSLIKKAFFTKEKKNGFFDWKIVVYDDIYTVKKEISIKPEELHNYGYKVPQRRLCKFLCVISTLLLLSNLYTYFKLNNIQYQYASLQEKYGELEEAYETAIIEEEQYKIHYFIGKYVIKKNSQITKDSVIRLLNDCGIWYPDLVFAQIVQESGIGKHTPEGNSNNLLGMKYAKSRETTAYASTKDGYGKYKNWELCVLDRALWDYAFFGYKKPSREAYKQKLSKLYAQDKNYIFKLETIIRKQYRNE